MNNLNDYIIPQEKKLLSKFSIAICMACVVFNATVLYFGEFAP